MTDLTKSSGPQPEGSAARPLVTMRGVRRVFVDDRTETVAAADVDLTIRDGEIVGLVGESGSGKSTIANILLGLVSADSGEIVVDGTALEVWLGRRERAYRALVQAVFQQPLLALDRRRTIGWAIAEPLVIHRSVPPADRADRVASLMQMVGLDPALSTRRPPELSGGQLQRVNIARALSLEPRLLVCDEAVSALDVSVQAQIVDLFLDLQERLGLAMLFISHNMAVVRHLSDSVVVMRHGEVVESGPTEEVCDAPRSEYARSLMEAWLDPAAVHRHRSTSRQQKKEERS